MTYTLAEVAAMVAGGIGVSMFLAYLLASREL